MVNSQVPWYIMHELIMINNGGMRIYALKFNLRNIAIELIY